MLVIRRIGEGCRRLDRFRYRSTYSCVRLAAARHRVEHDPVSWEMELKMREIGLSASRGLGPARQTDDAGRRGNGLGQYGWLATAKHRWRQEFGCRVYVVDAAGD